MPEAQLTAPLDHAAEKGGVKETFAALEAAVEAAHYFCRRNRGTRCGRTIPVDDLRP